MASTRTSLASAELIVTWFIDGAVTDIRPELAVLVRLEPGSRAALLPHVAPWLAREFRHHERDTAIRATVPLLEHLSRTEAPRELERMLRRYLGSAWAYERHMSELPASFGALRRALHLIARAGGGEALGWRQIRNIMDGHRG